MSYFFLHQIQLEPKELLQLAHRRPVAVMRALGQDPEFVAGISSLDEVVRVLISGG